MSKENLKTISENRAARHEYFVIESFETGIELVGTEVKSIRSGGVNLKDGWCSIDQGELYVKGMHISPYEKGNIFNKDLLRVKKLLMHKYEINKLVGKLDEQGYTLVPLQVYFKDGKAKIEVGLAKGKKLYDKRQDIAKKDQRRENERDFKIRNL